MKPYILRYVCITALVGSFVAPAMGQGALQTLSVMKIDSTSLESGYRASKLIGSNVVNESNEVVGKVDDLIVTRNENVPFVVLSVGGFLGVGKKYVVVLSSTLEVNGKTILLRGATKEAVKALPNYVYTK